MPDAVCQVKACGWKSTDWETQEQADVRLKEHMDEHETGVPAPELIESAANQVFPTFDSMEITSDDVQKMGGSK